MPTSPSRSASPSALATLDKVAARTPDGVTLFDNLSLTFGAERTGVVGRNGAGKSMLLRLISGASAPAEGVVARAGSVGVLDQRYDPAPNETAAQTLGVAEDLDIIVRVLAGDGTADAMAINSELAYQIYLRMYIGPHAPAELRNGLLGLTRLSRVGGGTVSPAEQP